MKKILLFILCCLIILIFNKYVSFEVDPCDIECDNYINSSLREDCYKKCYESSI